MTFSFRSHILFLTASALLLSACAMQRAKDAETAQRQMVGMEKESLFTCMGIPKRKATVGETEIWEYRSTDDHSEKGKTTSTVSGAKGVSESAFLDSLAASFSMGDEVRTKRACTVQVVMKADKVQKVHYVGPTGGFLTEDEQCAFAIRNCLKPDGT